MGDFSTGTIVIVTTFVEPVDVLMGATSFPATDVGMQFGPSVQTTDAEETEVEEVVS